jgi:hypothetical protein
MWIKSDSVSGLRHLRCREQRDRLVRVQKSNQTTQSSNENLHDLSTSERHTFKSSNSATPKIDNAAMICTIDDGSMVKKIDYPGTGNSTLAQIDQKILKPQRHHWSG